MWLQSAPGEWGWGLTRDGQVPQGAQCRVLNGHVALFHVAVQQLQELLHDPRVHHVDAVPIWRETETDGGASAGGGGGRGLQSLPLRAKLAMAKAPAS